MIPHVLTALADVNEALKELSPDALALLRVLSMFDGAAICQDLPILASKPKGGFFANNFDALDQLVDLSLVTRSDFRKVGRRTLQVHHSVQDTVRNGLNLDEFQKVFNSAVLALHHILPRVSPDNLYDLHGVQDAKLIRPHVARLRSLLEERGFDAVKPSLLLGKLFTLYSW
jgi:hypothetical protein